MQGKRPCNVSKHAVDDFFSDDDKIDVWDLLTLFLLFEKQSHKDSSVYNFINSMPKTYTLPLLWDRKIIDLLPEQTRKVVLETLEETKNRFELIERINKKAKLLVKLTEKDFLWTQASITSRNAWCSFITLKTCSAKKSPVAKKHNYNFRKSPKSEPKKVVEPAIFQFFDDSGINSEAIVPPKWLKTRTETDRSGIAPVFDMFNHSPTNNAFFDWDDINKRLYVAANRKIEAGEQIFINYQDREDGEMLMHYGFAFPPGFNMESYVEIEKQELVEAFQNEFGFSSNTILTRLNLCQTAKLNLTELKIHQ